MIGNRIAHPASAPAQHLAPRDWMLRQRLSSLSHRASATRVSGIIRDFHLELPGTVQYTFTRCFSTRQSAGGTTASSLSLPECISEPSPHRAIAQSPALHEGVSAVPGGALPKSTPATGTVRCWLVAVRAELFGPVSQDYAEPRSRCACRAVSSFPNCPAAKCSDRCGDVAGDLDGLFRTP